MYKVIIKRVGFENTYNKQNVDDAYEFVDAYIKTISKNVGSNIDIKITTNVGILVDEWVIEKNI